MKEIITADMKAAMLSGDKARLEVIRAISQSITNFEKSTEYNGEFGESEMRSILDKMRKQRAHSAEQYKAAGREDLSSVEEFQVSVINEYAEKFLPKLMSDDEIRMAFEEIVVAVGGKSGNPNSVIGKAMGEFSKKYKGRADMKQASAILKEVLA